MNKHRLIEIGKALLVLFIFFSSRYLQFVPIILFKMDVKNMTSADYAITNTFVDVMFVLLFILIYRKELIAEWRRYKSNFSKNFDVGLRYWLVGLLIMIVSNVLISMLTPLNNSENETAVQGLINATPYLMLLTAGILAPIVEEITFRKAFRGLFKHKWLFCLLSGFVFGFLHVAGASNPLDYLYIIPYGSLGFFFAYAYVKTDTIFTSLTMHAIHNTLLVLLSIIT